MPTDTEYRNAQQDRKSDPSVRCGPRDAPSRSRRVRATIRTEADYSTIVFWMMLLAGLSVLGACIVAPAWMGYERLAAQRADLATRAEELQASRDADQQAIGAAQESVAYNERLMIEELNYRRPGEEVLLTERGEQLVGDNRQLDHQDEESAWLRAMGRQDIRTILLAMSLGLIVFALVYYRPREKAGQLPGVRDIPVRPASAEFAEPGEGKVDGYLRKYDPTA